MDVDLEMVDTSRVARSGVVPADDLESDWIGRPQVQRQNNCFWVLLVSFTLAMTVFVVGTVYLGPGESPVTENEFSPESGIVGSDSKEKLQTGFVSIASGNKHHESTAMEKWMKEQGVGGGEVTARGNRTHVNINHGIHGHSKVTTPGVKSHAHSDTSTSTGTTQTPNTAGDSSQNSGDNAPPSGSGNNAPPSTSPDVAAWLATTVTKGDGIMYEIVGQLVHDNKAFIEGLTYVNGLIYESTGLYGHSSVRTLDPETGHGVQLFPVSKKYFGEGLAYANGKFYQLTYKSQIGFIYDAADLSKDPQKFNYSSTTNEGYGLTFDAGKQEFIESDGSEYLHFWDPQTFQELRKVKVVRQDGTAALRMNELEWWRGRILANVWFEDVILVIDPVTGVVEKEYGRSPCNRDIRFRFAFSHACDYVFEQTFQRYGRKLREVQ
jgi:glutamine cyclotransferase